MASRIVLVTAAAKLSAISGSSQSACAGTAIRPSAAYGYREAPSSTITTCSPTHRVANPAASAPAATASITSRRAPVPIPSAWSPSRTVGADRQPAPSGGGSSSPITPSGTTTQACLRDSQTERCGG